MEFYISPQSGQFYMINVLENQWLSVTYKRRLLRLHIGQPGNLENYPLLNQYIPGALPTNTGNYYCGVCAMFTFLTSL